jgi:hypothetical protein
MFYPIRNLIYICDKTKHYSYRQCISYPLLYEDWVYVKVILIIPFKVHFIQSYPKCYPIGYILSVV